MYGTDPFSSTEKDKKNINLYRESYLNDCTVRLTILCMILFMASLHRFTDSTFEIHEYSVHEAVLRLQASSSFFIWFGSFLILFVMNVPLFDYKSVFVKYPISIILILGSVLHFFSAIQQASDNCVGVNFLDVSHENGTCWAGYFGTAMLVILFPVLICLDLIADILSDIRVRLAFYTFVLLITGIFFNVARFHFNVDETEETIINNAIQAGWVIAMLVQGIICLANIMLLKMDFLSNMNHDHVSLITKLLGLCIITGVSLASIGQCSETSGNGSCFWTHFWFYIAVNIIVAYEIQKF